VEHALLPVLPLSPELLLPVQRQPHALALSSLALELPVAGAAAPPT
jgi:hypothetical protein